MRQIHHYVNGAVVPGTSGRTSPVFNPATGEQQAEVDLASDSEVDAVVASSRAAWLSWRSSSLTARTQVMFDFREILSSRRGELAKVVSSEHGKVVADAEGEVVRGLENVEFACGIAQHLKGDINEQASTGIDVYTVRQPVGVVAGITPFNFPAMVPSWMFATAIACGNAFICKPSMPTRRLMSISISGMALRTISSSLSIEAIAPVSSITDALTTTRSPVR